MASDNAAEPAYKQKTSAKEAIIRSVANYIGPAYPEAAKLALEIIASESIEQAQEPAIVLSERAKLCLSACGHEAVAKAIFSRRIIGNESETLVQYIKQLFSVKPTPDQHLYTREQVEKCALDFYFYRLNQEGTINTKEEFKIFMKDVYKPS